MNSCTSQPPAVMIICIKKSLHIKTEILKEMGESIAAEHPISISNSSVYLASDHSSLNEMLRLELCTEVSGLFVYSLFTETLKLLLSVYPYLCRDFHSPNCDKLIHLGSLFIHMILAFTSEVIVFKLHIHMLGSVFIHYRK